MADAKSIVFVVISVCSLLCNLLALIVVGRVLRRDIHNISLKMLVNLISSGLLLSIMTLSSYFGMLYLKENVDGDKHTYDVYCKASAYFINIFYVEIFITLTGISWERWCVVCRPLCARHLVTKKKLYIFLACSWVITLLSNLPLPFQLSGAEPSVVGFVCADIVYVNTVLWKSLACLVFVVGFIAPVTIMIVMYGRMTVALVYKPRPVIDTKGSDKFTKQRLKTAKVSLIISCQFTLCYGPFSGYVLCVAFGGPGQFQNELVSFILANIVPMIGVTLNPVLFCYALESFRREIRSWIKSGCRQSYALRRQSTVNMDRSSSRCLHANNVKANVKTLNVKTIKTLKVTVV